MSTTVHSTTWLNGAQWLAVLRIGLGAWWFKSFWHKDKTAWFKRGAGISWGQSVAEKHKWPFVKKGFDAIVVPRPKIMAYVVVLGELAIGLGLMAGFLTPVAAVAGILLNIMYFILMISDWAEQGQNFMMVLASVVVLGTHSWDIWSIDHVLHLFGA
ncbi:MAG TPA: DoxX family protein [Acidimicrobiales bacterium]|nr:DoxX family protein [Acidimicrobiales bacterium]